jgi:hypothetical protein
MNLHVNDVATDGCTLHYILLFITIDLPALLYSGSSAIDDVRESLLFQEFLAHLPTSSTATMRNNGRVLWQVIRYRHCGSVTIPWHIDSMRAYTRTGHWRQRHRRLVFSGRVAQIHDDQVIARFVHELLQLFGRRHSGGRWVVVGIL